MKIRKGRSFDISAYAKRKNVCTRDWNLKGLIVSTYDLVGTLRSNSDLYHFYFFVTLLLWPLHNSRSFSCNLLEKLIAQSWN